METTELSIDTRGRHVLDLTDRAAAFARQAGGDGLMQVFVPHATAGLADHLLPVFAGPSLTVPVQAGRLLLGTWQRICLVDLNDDNPRRRVRLSYLAG